jgi:O-antigen ligase
MGALGYLAASASFQLSEKHGIKYLLLGVLNIGITVLTGSRMATAMALFVCGFTFFYGFRRRPLSNAFITIYGVLVGGAFLVTFGDVILKRAAVGGLTGRDLIWWAVEQQLALHPIFGVGLGHQYLLIPASVTQRTATIAAHSEYLRMAVEFGYPGAVIFFIAVAALLLIVWRSRWVQRDPRFLVMSCSFFIYCITDNSLGGPEGFLILTLASFSCGPRTASIPSASHDRPVGLRDPGQISKLLFLPKSASQRRMLTS